MKIEYIAHASFIIHSERGTKVAIDPYNGQHSLGYHFPVNLSADAVLVTHPHFDHDASYYFGPQVPVLTSEGQFRVNEVMVTGIKAEHVGAARFRLAGALPHNTIWKIEVNGVQVVHLGDNGLLSDALLTEIGKVDVLLIQVFEDHHLYDDAAFERVIGALQPSVIVPMHYQLTAISDIPSWTGDVDPWLAAHGGEAIEGNVLELSSDQLDVSAPQIIKLSHSPLVKPWGAALRSSWDEFQAVRIQMVRRDTAYTSLEKRLAEITEEFENVLIYQNLHARILDSLGREDEVRQVLVQGLANAGPDDWEQQMIAHGRLARYYKDINRPQLAAEHYRWILGHQRTYQQVLLDEARLFMENLQEP